MVDVASRPSSPVFGSASRWSHSQSGSGAPAASLGLPFETAPSHRATSSRRGIESMAVRTRRTRRSASSPATDRRRSWPRSHAGRRSRLDYRAELRRPGELSRCTRRRLLALPDAAVEDAAQPADSTHAAPRRRDCGHARFTYGLEFLGALAVSSARR